MNIEVPKKISCVDCGQEAHLISYEPEEGWEYGDILTYRCRGCNDRWDLVLEENDASVSKDFDFRSWLDSRKSD